MVMFLFFAHFRETNSPRDAGEFGGDSRQAMHHTTKGYSDGEAYPRGAVLTLETCRRHVESNLNCVNIIRES